MWLAITGWALGALIGCPNKDEGVEGDDDDTDDTPSDTGPTATIAFTAGPTVVANPTAGLTAWLDVTLAEPAALAVDVTGPARSWTVSSPAAQQHHLLLTGFRASVNHPIHVRVVDGGGATLNSADVSFTPAALPPDFFPWTTNVSVPSAMEPGATLVGFGNYLLMLDPEGEAVWYVPVTGSIHEANLLANGHLMVLINRTSVTEFDLAGTIVRQWRAARATDQPATAIPVDVDALHHDVIELPDGNFATLSIERRWIEDYPSSEQTPGVTAPAWVAGDVLVEYTPEGQVVHSYPLLDRLDPLRIGYDAVVGNYWEDLPAWLGDDIKDWSHGNAVSYDPVSDTFLVSMRHQDTVAGIDRQTGDLAWILAPDANWPPELEPYVLTPTSVTYEPAYHQHGAKFTPDGTIMLFDNGNNRASPYDTKLEDWYNYSRGLEVAIDPVAKTVTEVFSYGKDLVPSHYSGSLGDMDPLPTTGNVLITFGNIANPDLGGVELVEVTRSGEVVFDLTVPYSTLTAYRCERLAGVIQGL